MMKGQLTRAEAIKLAGIIAVDKVEALNCEPTNRVGYNGACQDDDLTEWSASVTLDNGDVLTAYYYTDNDEDEAMGNADGDGSVIDWIIAGYDID